jgi:probable HAF family extracellular repeat protein
MMNKESLGGWLGIVWLVFTLTSCGGAPAAPASVPDPPVVSSPPPTQPPPSNQPPAMPTVWTVTDLPPLDGMQTSWANAVNASGTVAGYSDDALGNAHATVWENGILRELGLGIAVAINDSGTVVGYSGADALMWQAGAVTNMGQWQPHGINNAGVVVGSDPTNATAVSWSPNTGLQIVSGCIDALAINNKGQIAGITNQVTAGICGHTDYQVPGAVYAINDSGMAVGVETFELDNADALVFPGDDIEVSALATGVNQWGWVVGQEIGEDPVGGWKKRLMGQSHPFVWSKDTGIQWLPMPPNGYVKGIHDRFIVGYGVTADGQTIHGILLEGQ